MIGLDQYKVPHHLRITKKHIAKVMLHGGAYMMAADAICRVLIVLTAIEIFRHIHELAQFAGSQGAMIAGFGAILDAGGE